MTHNPSDIDAGDSRLDLDRNRNRDGDRDGDGDVNPDRDGHRFTGPATAAAMLARG